MNFYVVTDGLNAAHYCATLDEAHQKMKQAPASRRHFVEAVLVDVSTDKANMLRLLNLERGYESEPLRRWELTPRGGLKEVNAKEEE